MEGAGRRVEGDVRPTGRPFARGSKGGQDCQCHPNSGLSRARGGRLPRTNVRRRRQSSRHKPDFFYSPTVPYFLFSEGVGGECRHRSSSVGFSLRFGIEWASNVLPHSGQRPLAFCRRQ